MARFVAGAFLGLVVGVVAGAAAGIHADEVEAAAAEAGVDEQDLRGAMNSTGLAARQYLTSVSELPQAVAVPAATTGAATVSGVWDRLANCEASGIWSSASNPRYKGGLQMDAAFWANHGGLAYAPAPHLATRAQQIQVAINGRDGIIGKAQGWAAWPVCSRRLGLR